MIPPPLGTRLKAKPQPAAYEVWVDDCGSCAVDNLTAKNSCCCQQHGFQEVVG